MIHQPVVDIINDPGGKVFDHQVQVARWRREGATVEIKGTCASACTLALGLPPDKVCVTPAAVLGFHTASDAVGTAILKKAYPQKVKAWLGERGGLQDAGAMGVRCRCGGARQAVRGALNRAAGYPPKSGAMIRLLSSFVLSAHYREA